MVRAGLAALGLLGAGCLQPPAAMIDLAVTASPGWSETRWRRALDEAEARLSVCSVGLRPAREGVLALEFVDQLPPLPDGRARSGLVLAPRGSQTPTARISADHAAGAVIAHELGHLLGLGHAPDHAIDLMAPGGCRLCDFSAEQCTVIRQGARRLQSRAP